MIKDVTLPLDSYRLAQYAVQIPCYICSGGNTFDAELCRHCFAPMALAHQSNTQKLMPRMLATLGPSGAGKTVYLGMLMDMLSRSTDQLQLLARGAFSINLQQSVVTSLADCSFPFKTPNEPDRWNWVHCQVRNRSRRQPRDLIMPDMAGEALLEEVEHPYSYQVIRALLGKCGGVTVLVDAPQLKDGGREHEYFTMKLLTYLLELDPEEKQGWPSRPVAIVFTKADQCEECFVDPAAFARNHASGLWQHCHERFRQHRYFAAGIAGSSAWVNIPGEGRVRIPLRIEPRGVIEPFAWLLDRVRD